MEHTVSILNLCRYYAAAYDFLSADLLYAAALYHDIGKTKELSAFPENDYTDDGQLLGHIVIGVEMLDEAIRAIPGFPPKLASELKHCILSHHGELEYGSPKKPALCGGNGAESGGYDGRQDADDERDPERQTYDGMARIQSIV